MQEPRIPTSDDVSQLPRWARVAFAVQCARRVQPFLRAALPTATTRQIQAVERALTLAEAVAREAPEWAPDKVVIRLHAAFKAADKLAKAVEEQDPIASAIALAAANAAQAAEYACCASRKRDATGAAEAARAAYAAVPTEAMRAELFESWQSLLAAAQAEGWTNRTAVPARFFKT
jgi:hypothetical protein